MASIYPVPAGRSANSLIKSRLLMQLQVRQQELLRVQQQLATGRRVLTPSDDAVAATRAMAVQRHLELKHQIQTNLDTTESYLNATDTALAGVAELLTHVRGLAVRAADTTTSDLEREAIVAEVEETIDRMLDVGNETFRDRYLFGGSQADAPPFEVVDGYVRFSGNDVVLRSFADIELLFDTNVPGQDLFGAVSAEMQGIDLDPVVSPQTRLADLRRGAGIARGSFVISDGTNSSTIDISAAETLGDVARLIEANPPDGREVWATVTPGGLHIAIQPGGGSLSIQDVPGGTTARDLGIRRAAGLASEPIVGQDLDPILRETTSIADIMGARARAVLRSPGANNDLILEARARGDAYNGYTIQLVDDRLLQAAPGLPAGQERAELQTAPVAARAALPLTGFGNDLVLTAVDPGVQWNNVTIRLETAAGLGNAAQVDYDPGSRVLTLTVDDADQTTTATLVNAIDASGWFTASGDDSLGETLNPAAPVLALDAGDRGSTGNSGGEANTMFVYIEPGESTASQVAAALQSNPDINDRFTVEVDDQDASSPALAGSWAVDVNASAQTAYGSGSDWDTGSGLQIQQGDQAYTVEFPSAETVEDLLNALNTSEASVLAEINDEQNGINLRSRLSGADFAVGENGGTTATELGLRSLVGETPLEELNFGRGVQTGNGADLIIQRNDGTELEVDLSSARTLNDVIELINSHPDNQDPSTSVTAGLRTVGNGLQLIDDNPNGTNSVAVRLAATSFAAWDLGLVPRGEEISAADALTRATPASGTVSLAPPDEQNTGIVVTAGQAGTAFNGVQVQYVNNVASGDQALVSYDPVGGVLSIDVDPASTSANTVVAAINAEGTFSATLETTQDPGNDGTGLVTQTGVRGELAGGTPEVFTGNDPHPLEAEGIFNSLIRLRAAVADYQVEEIQRIFPLFDQDFDRLNVGRAVLGSQGRSLEALQSRHVDEELELQQTLSQDIDIDMAVAVSNYAAQQTAYEAALQTMGNLFRLSLLDFL